MISKERENDILLDVLAHSAEGRNKGFYWTMVRFFVDNCQGVGIINAQLRTGVLEIFGSQTGYDLICEVLDNGDYDDISEDDKDEFLDSINMWLNEYTNE